MMAPYWFVNAKLAWTIGPVVVPFLWDVAFNGQLELAMLTVTMVACPAIAPFRTT